ncbi:cell division protein PerM [Streptomyces cremeus]|uniref:DUF6350 family protein n=1 Tax=Streptomyces cremeus TaxID=66881 RepID=A0ABV5PG78_STRCM
MNPNPVTEQPLPQAPHHEGPERTGHQGQQGQQGQGEQQEPRPRPTDAAKSPRAVWAACVVRGALAAGLGLGTFAVLAMVLWISSPYPDAGAGAALRVAAGLWLLAHGADLVRHDTLDAVAAPVGLTPLLCSVLPLWLAHRTARDACEEDGEDGATRSAASRWQAFGGVTLGYLLVGGLAAAHAAGGPLPATAGSTALHLPLVVGAATTAGVWRAYGRPRGPLPHWVPGGVRRALMRPRLTVAARAAGAGVAVLVGGGALLVGISLGWHAGLAQETFVRLAGEWSGRVGVLLLALALVPNAAVWGACYGLGAGFEAGAGATVAPLAAAGTGAVPPFPLLAALPGEGRGTALNWAAAGVPLAAAVVVAWMVVRVAAPVCAVREEAWGRRRTAGAVALAGGACGVLTAVLAAASGGPLGVGWLAEFGPVGWAAGLAAAGWVVLVGVPAALGMRAWRLRERAGWRRPPAVLPAADAAPTPAVVPAAVPTPAVVPAPAAGPIPAVVPTPATRHPGVSAQAASLHAPSGPQAPWPPAPEHAPPVRAVPSSAPPARAAYASEPPGTAVRSSPEHGSRHDSGARDVRWAALREGSGGIAAEVRDEGEEPPPAPGG